jgi:hypothetical protein
MTSIVAWNLYLESVNLEKRERMNFNLVYFIESFFLNNILWDYRL